MFGIFTVQPDEKLGSEIAFSIEIEPTDGCEISDAND
jgi:hypothetical protein